MTNQKLNIPKPRNQTINYFEKKKSKPPLLIILAYRKTWLYLGKNSVPNFLHGYFQREPIVHWMVFPGWFHLKDLREICQGTVQVAPSLYFLPTPWPDASSTYHSPPVRGVEKKRVPLKVTIYTNKKKNTIHC